MMGKKRQYNCLRRAKAWAGIADVLTPHYYHNPNGWWVDRARVAVSVAALMREAYSEGYEAGYKERGKT